MMRNLNKEHTVNDLRNVLRIDQPKDTTNAQNNTKKQRAMHKCTAFKI